MQELNYLFKAFGSLATWVKVIIFVLLATTLIGATALVFDRKAALIVAAGIIVLTCILLVYLLVIHLVRRHQSALLKGEIASQAAHRGIVDPAARGRLEDLHRAFIQGLEKFTLAGKDLYRMPWFVFVGEPGSGKSEAIRRSGVGFPPGMQDEYQGVGGTVNMNWWFTNHAIILDVAGRLMFEEIEPGTTGEWRSFLGLLRKYRFHCPINGLLLTISAESLIHDAPEVMEQKAVRIAQQLEVIRRELYIRFPVFVLLTKADRITGFREFFENIEDAKSQHQMLGWSNPASLDAPFRPELVDQHLEAVSERLEQRRFSLLADPSPVHGGKRRLDEVDRLFQFPANLRSLAPRLRRYLETIFVAGEWSARPLFLRGIYFTSAMREGAELDEEVAVALGVKVDSVALSNDRVWEQDRSFFLRDVFLDKVFREDGLVTRATHANRALFGRHFMIFGSGLIGLAALLLFGVLGYQSFQNSILQETLLWARASTGWQQNSWNPIVVADPSGTALWKYQGDQPVKTFLNPRLGLAKNPKTLSLLEFHEVLCETCSEQLALPWVFAPFAHFGSDLNEERTRMQKIVFEGSIVRPLFAAAFAKMSEPQPEFPRAGKPDPRPVSELGALEMESLLALVRLEIERVKPGLFSAEEGPGKIYLVPLLKYVSGKQGDEELAELMNWTYARNGGFPPAWLDNDPEMPPAIREGLARAMRGAEEALTERAASLHLLLDLANAVREYQNLETDLSQKANIKNDPATGDREVQTAFDRLRDAKVALEAKLAAVAQARLFPANTQTLSDAYQTLSSVSEARLGFIRLLNSDLEKVLPTPQPSPSASPSASPPSDYRLQTLKKFEQEINNRNEFEPRYSFLREIKSRLSPLWQEIKTRVDAGVSPQQLEEFKSLDHAFLALGGEDEPLYLQRWDLYQAARAALPQTSRFVDQSNLVGQNLLPLKEVVDSVESLRAKIDDYNAPFREPFLNTTNYLLGRAEDTQRDGFATAYLQEFKTKLSRQLKFPLVWPPGADSDSMTVPEIVEVRGLLAAYRRDVQSPSFQKLAPAARTELTELTKNLDKISTVCEALVREDGTSCDTTLNLLNGQAQRQLSGPDFAPAPTPSPTPPPPKRSFLSRLLVHHKTAPTPTPTPYFNPRNWNSVELIGGSKVDPSDKSGLVPLDGASDSNLGRFPVDAPFRFRLFHTPKGGGSYEVVEAGENWSALRLLSRFGGKPVDAGQYWRVALRPGEPTAVWVQIFFERPLPSFESWPTLESVGLRGLTR